MCTLLFSFVSGNKMRKWVSGGYVHSSRSQVSRWQVHSGSQVIEITKIHTLANPTAYSQELMKKAWGSQWRKKDMMVRQGG